MALSALRKLRCSGIRTPDGTLIALDTIDSTVTQAINDIKGAPDKKDSALRKLPALLRFLSSDQSKQVTTSLVEMLKKDSTIALKARAAEVLELMINESNAETLVNKDEVIPLLVSMINTSLVAARQFAFRSLHQLAHIPATHQKLAAGAIPIALTEIHKDPAQICSDAPLHLLSILATDATYATQMVNGGCLPSLLSILRSATAPCKLFPPTLKIIRTLARHDSYALRAILTAGAAQLIIPFISRRSLMLPKLHLDAASIICEFACTKDPEAQTLLIRAGLGPALSACLVHSNDDVRRHATIALERWIYTDDRLTVYAAEFFLTLVQNGVEVSAHVKELLKDIQPVVKPGPNASTIAALLNEIKQRPDSNSEISRLRSENSTLQHSLKAAQEHIKVLEKVTVKAAAKAADAPAPTEKKVDVSGIATLDELSELESKIVQRRQQLFSQIQESLTCGICLDKKKDSCFLPCGHSLCQGCAEQMQRRTGSCHVCRARIDRIGKLFL